MKLRYDKFPPDSHKSASIEHYSHSQHSLIPSSNPLRGEFSNWPSKGRPGLAIGISQSLYREKSRASTSKPLEIARFLSTRNYARHDFNRKAGFVENVREKENRIVYYRKPSAALPPLPFPSLSLSFPPLPSMIINNYVTAEHQCVLALEFRYKSRARNKQQTLT